MAMIGARPPIPGPLHVHDEAFMASRVAYKSNASVRPLARRWAGDFLHGPALRVDDHAEISTTVASRHEAPGPG